MSDALSLQHLEAKRRFELSVDGQACVLDYSLHPSDAGVVVMSITHTYVPAVLQGRGLAAQLVAAALAHARTQGWKVEPICSYALSYMNKHADTADLRAR
jgi:predicted GNAT family acetyltransferase